MAELAPNPFPGLRPFEIDDEHLFFGREGQSEELLDRLRANRFLAVVGSSGSGKSSLIRAGLLPYVHGGFLSGGSHWRVAVFRPGGDPIGKMAAALNDPSVLGEPGVGGEAHAQSAMLLEITLRRGGLGLVEAVRLARLQEQEQLLIVIDQFEELFRFARAAGEPGGTDDAAAFVTLLLEASRQQELPIFVVITMRSDFIGDCARYRDLPETVTRGLYLVPRMMREQRRAAIVEPVRVGGASIAPALVVRLLNDVSDDPDQLPILQHALMRCWDHWAAQGDGSRPIGLGDYEAIGGMAEALSCHADEAYEGLSKGLSAVARRIFQALTERGPDNREARRPTTVATLAEIAHASVADIIRVVDAFRAPGRSFLMPPAATALDPASVIDISHESLIRGWGRLRDWVEQEAESARVYRRLAETAALYAQGEAGLWRDPDLTHALTWREEEQPSAAWAARYHPDFATAMAFLDNSRAGRDEELRRREVNRRRTLAASIATASLFAVLAVLAVWEWRSANAERDRAQHGLMAATRLAGALVVDVGRDVALHGLPHDLVRQLSDRAIQGYDRMIASSPSAEAFEGRGHAHYQNNDYDRAIADFDQAIRLAPNDAEAHAGRADAYRGKRELDRAMADYDRAVELDPTYAEAFANRCWTRVIAGQRLPEAVADCTAALKLRPDSPQPLISRGFAKLKLGRPAEAAADFNAALQIDPRLVAAIYGRGLAESKQGNPAGADADIAAAKAAKPDIAEAMARDGIR